MSHLRELVSSLKHNLNTIQVELSWNSRRFDLDDCSHEWGRRRDEADGRWIALASLENVTDPVQQPSALELVAVSQQSCGYLAVSLNGGDGDRFRQSGQATLSESFRGRAGVAKTTITPRGLP